MDQNEVVQREAEHKAAALHHLGWQGRSWCGDLGAGVQDELERHEAARERFGTRPDRETWERLHGTALMLVVAIDQVLGFEKRVSRLTGDAELEEARKRFDSVGPDAEALRDLVAHLDSYAVGEGWRQKGKWQPKIEQQYVSALIYWGDREGTILNLANDQMNLRAAAQEAVRLEHEVERARAEHLELVEQEANAALRRRHGLPPE